LFVVALHVVLCLFLILIIILQPGKGGDVGAAFGGGGGSSTVFGPRGPTGLLQRATTLVAVMFMGTSITLALYSNQRLMNDANIDDEILRLQQEKLKAIPPSVEEAPE
jgi:preprotein translocase subunit SecG